MTKRQSREEWKRMKAERRTRRPGRPRKSSRNRHPRETGLGSTVFGGLFILGILGVLVFQAAERFPEYLGPVVAATSFQTVEGRVTRVRDGDTIEVADDPIRLGSLDCAEMDTREGQRTTARMRSLISGKTLTCYLNGRSSHDRKIASCRLSHGRDIAAVMMAEDLCRRFW